MANQPIKISVVLDLMSKGYTRLEKDNTAGIGSLQTFYDLTPADQKTLFNHPKVKGVRVVIPAPELEIIDDTELEITDDTEVETAIPTTVEAQLEEVANTIDAEEDAVFA